MGPTFLANLLSERTFGPGVQRTLRGLRPWLERFAQRGYFGIHEPWPTRGPERILLLAGHWLGDTFWAAQTVAELRRRYPESEIWVATRQRVRVLWRGSVPEHQILDCPHLVSDRRRDKVSWPGIRKLAAELRALQPDLILDLSGNRYTALLAFMARPRRAYGCASNPLEGLYSRSPRAFGEQAHLAERPYVALARLGITAPQRPLPLPIPTPRAEAVRHRYQIPARAPILALAPGAGWASKRWPPERFGQLAAELEDLGLHPVVFGSANERPLLESVAARTTRGIALPGLSIPSTLALLRQARLLVANDSGLGHLAAAEGTTVVSLFSATNPARYRPLGPRVRVLRAGCSDRPERAQEHCHDQAGFACPASCWDTLSVPQVVAACRQELLR
ncbi:MAG: glycosyltransferase family 9 protein [Planctomycetes bacterium]|nr:glycosyltransferase family 9 protein [Planctomycetota bacterium]